MPGDCGAGVVNATTGLLYGHIVAGDPHSGVAYIIPAHKVFLDIERRCGTRPALYNHAADSAISTIPIKSGAVLTRDFPVEEQTQRLTLTFWPRKFMQIHHLWFMIMCHFLILIRLLIAVLVFNLSPAQRDYSPTFNASSQCLSTSDYGARQLLPGALDKCSCPNTNIGYPNYFDVLYTSKYIYASEYINPDWGSAAYRDYLQRFSNPVSREPKRACINSVGLIIGHEVATSGSPRLGKSFADHGFPLIQQALPKKQIHNDARMCDYLTHCYGTLFIGKGPGEQRFELATRPPPRRASGTPDCAERIPWGLASRRPPGAEERLPPYTSAWDKTLRISAWVFSLDSRTAKAACEAYALSRRHLEYSYYVYEYSYYPVHGISFLCHPPIIAGQALCGYIEGLLPFRTNKASPVKDKFKSAITIHAVLGEFSSNMSQKDFHRHLSPITVPCSLNFTSRKCLIDLVVWGDITNIICTASPTGFSIADTRISAGDPAVTVSGMRSTLGDSGKLIVGSQTLSVNQSSPTAAADEAPIISAGETITPQPSGFIFHEPTVLSGGSAIAVSGASISSATNGVLIVSTSVTTLAPNTDAQHNVLASQTIPAQASGFTHSAATALPGGSAVVVNETRI